MIDSRQVNLSYLVEATVRIIKSENIELVSQIDLLPLIEEKNRANVIIYFVKKGDTLWNIAKKYNTTTAAIMAANNLESPDLSVGQQLVL
jgi:LysM repeat protein